MGKIYKFISYFLPLDKTDFLYLDNVNMDEEPKSQRKLLLFCW